MSLESFVSPHFNQFIRKLVNFTTAPPLAELHLGAGHDRIPSVRPPLGRRIAAYPAFTPISRLPRAPPPRSDGSRHGRAQPQSPLLGASQCDIQWAIYQLAELQCGSTLDRSLQPPPTATDPTESGGVLHSKQDVEWACKQTSPEPPRNDSTFVTRMCLQKTTPARDANSVTPPAGSNTPTHQPTLRQLATAAAHIFPPSATLLSHRRAQRLLHRSAADLLYAPSDLARELTARRHALPSRSMVPHSFPPTRPAPPTPLCGRRPATPSRPTVSPA